MNLSDDHPLSSVSSTAIIVAAGTGTRMGKNVNKLFLEIHDKPVIAHTWQAFENAQHIKKIVLVVREETKSDFLEIAKEFQFQKPYDLVIGGKERQDSVWNGIQSIEDNQGLVAIHDGARPCISDEVITDCLIAAHKSGASVCASLPVDTIKYSEDGTFISEHLDRSKLRLVQTPQCFRLEVIRKALQSAIDQGEVFTDDTAACQAIGQNVELVIHQTPNIKITTPNDLPLASLFLS